MNTQVISIINFKGGVGKSTITFNLGAELAQKGYAVLLIDFDGQGNLSKFAGIEKIYDGTEFNIVSKLNEIVIGDISDNDPIYKLCFDGKLELDIIPCNIIKEEWMNRALSEMARETILKRYIDVIKDKYNYDYILIDNAPSINLDFQNALVASDKYLVVTQAESASMDGMDTIFNIIQQIKTYFNPELRSAGIVINQIEERTNVHAMMREFIKDRWQEFYIFDVAIPKSIVVAESELLNKPVCVYKPLSKVGIAFSSFAAELEKIDILN